MVDSEKFIFKKYYKSLCYFAWQLVHDQRLAEDLAQDAFVSYFQQKEQVSREENSIKAFLYSSIRYAVYNSARKNKTVKKFWERNVYTEIDDTDYEHNIIRAEFLTSIHSAISSLPEACQQVIKLSYVEGLSNLEIAEELQLSINTIKTQKQRGLKALRKSLSPEFLGLFLLFFR